MAVYIRATEHLIIYSYGTLHVVETNFDGVKEFYINRLETVIPNSIFSNNNELNEYIWRHDL